MPNSVLIVDDSPIVRKIMRDYFETLTDWKIKGEAGDGAEAIQRASELRPDMILLDFSMPNMNGIESASVLKKMLPHAHIIVFTMFDAALSSRLGSAIGVDLVVPKSEGLNGLVKIVNHVMTSAGLIDNSAQAEPQVQGEQSM
jgi:DNA-binding NarL/FixJ family response regulator